MHGEVSHTVTRGALVCTTDRARLPHEDAFMLVRTAMWAQDMPRELFERAVEGSVCFSVLEHERLIAFGRAVTDLATYAYWTDIVVDVGARGRGIGRFLVETMLGHPQLQGLRRVALLTADARGLYEKFGFATETGHNTYMERRAGSPPPAGAAR